MKKFLVLLGLIMCICSCSPINRCEYLCTITYNIDGISHTEEIKIAASDVCTPAYVHSVDIVRITAYPSNYWHEDYVVYRGSLPIKVEDFEYKLLREFKVSPISGKELK